MVLSPLVLVLRGLGIGIGIEGQNFDSIGIGIGIEGPSIDFWYWYWYWYCNPCVKRDIPVKHSFSIPQPVGSRKSILTKFFLWKKVDTIFLYRTLCFKSFASDKKAAPDTPETPDFQKYK